MKYHVTKDVQELLVHASLHALMWPNLGKRVSSELPPAGRILLQTSSTGTSKFQEAVAAALASKMQVLPAFIIYAWWRLAALLTTKWVGPLVVVRCTLGAVLPS